MKRPDAPRPEVQETDYGAKYVKAATETKAEETVELDAAPEATEEVSPQPEDVKPVEEEEKPKKKKGGRPKKK